MSCGKMADRIVSLAVINGIRICQKGTRLGFNGQSDDGFKKFWLDITVIPLFTKMRLDSNEFIFFEESGKTGCTQEIAQL